MKNKLFLSLIAAASTLAAVEIPVDLGNKKLTFDTRGGGIKSIIWKKKSYSIPSGVHAGSFTERVMADTIKNGKPAQFQERFDNLQFKAEFLKRYWMVNEIEFSARGTGAFDWLRITKVYTVYRNRPVISVKYILTNLDSKPHSAALWSRTFLRASEDGKNANLYLQPRKNGVAELLHPGPSVTGDEWSIAPAKSWSAVYDPKTKRGAIVMLPAEKPVAFYSWFSLKDPMGTLEFVTGERALAPGKSASFSIEVLLSENVPAELKKPGIAKLDKVKAAEKSIYYPKYLAAGKERSISIYQNLGGTLPRSRNSMNLTVPRQFTASVREVILPPQADPANVAVFEVANKRADYSREVPSRCIKKGDGSNVLLFGVPGVNTSYHGIKIADDRTFRNSKNEFYGMADFNVEIAFDRKASKLLDLKGFDKGANLVYNGFFTVPHTKLKNLPDGYPSNFYGNRLRWYSWKDGVFAVNKPSNKPVDKWVGFGPFFVLEKDMKYTVSVKLRNDNRIKGVAVGSISFLDAKGKDIRTHQLRFYPGNTNAHEWKTLTKEFYTPAGAVYARLGFNLYGVREQTLYFDDLQIVPRPYSAVQVKLVDRLRDQLKNSWYKPIDYIERNHHDVETPHVKWMKNAAFKMPEILFLPMSNGSYSTLERRFIVEMLQRTDLEYKMIPLLRHVSYINGSGIMGVYSNTMESRLEAYTLERLKEVKKISPVVLLNGVDFKVTGKEVVEFLNRAVKGNSKIFFVNCANVPVKILGKRKTNIQELLLIPQIRQVAPGNLHRWLSLYEKGAVISTLPASFRFNPVVPGEQISNRYPDFIGRDYPFMEYTYLAALRVLRHLAGADAGARLVSAVQKQENVLIKGEKLPAGAVLKNGYRWANEYFPLPDIKVTGNTITVPVNALPEKLSVLEFRLVDAGGKALDAGAVAVTRAAKINLAVKGDKKCFRHGDTITFTASAAQIPAGMALRVRIEDNDRRVVYDRKGTGKEFKVAFVPQMPYAAFYRIIATVEGAGKTPARALGEFTVTALPKDPAELLTVMWPAGDSAKYPLYRKHGYDQLIVWCRDNTPALRALRSVGIDPVIYGIGYTSYTNWKTYKDDKATADPVRIPCFSDPAAAKKALANVKELMTKNNLTYYGVEHHFIGDEQYIGSTVCFSEHCLKEFRKVLQKEFKTLEALNKSWGSTFKSWEEVTPLQSKDLKDRSRLGRWLDHKIFMNNVFAHTYVGGVRQAIKNLLPDSRTGLSGTYNPGPTYEWSQIMKQADYVAYYSGIQRKLAQDFGGKNLFSGQWYGGYVLPVPREGYAGSHFWRGFLIGANLSPIYAPRAGITGDLKLTPVLQHYDKLLTESRKGLGKLILSSSEVPRIAMLYSQRSLFACTGTIGANEWQNAISGWHALLGDLGMDYRFIDKEILESKGVDAQFKVLILPGAIALSDKEIAQIENFVKKGGTVIADMAPGIYDEHGALRQKSAFAGRFGCTAPKIPEVIQTQVDFKGNASGVPAVKGDFRTLNGTNSFFHTSALGKGKIVGINLLLSGYQTVTLGGTGGETAQATSGAAAFCRAWRIIAKGALVKAGIAPHREITDAKGNEAFAESCWRSNGDNHVLGLLKFDTSVPVIDPKTGTQITVKVPVKGHVTNLRTGKYLGYTDKVNVLLIPAKGEFFSVMKEKVAKVALTAPRRIKAGAPLNFTAKAVTHSGRSAGKVVIHWEFISPSGKRYDRYTGNILSGADGAVQHSFQSAFNDEKGAWTLNVSCVNSATSNSVKVTVE